MSIGAEKSEWLLENVAVETDERVACCLASEPVHEHKYKKGKKKGEKKAP